jgi:hypothetical protein
VGYGDLHPYSVGETILTICFIMVNIGLSAYIIGSVSMLVVKSDAKFDKYRDRISALFAYAKINNLTKVGRQVAAKPVSVLVVKPDASLASAGVASRRCLLTPRSTTSQR